MDNSCPVEMLTCFAKVLSLYQVIIKQSDHKNQELEPKQMDNHRLVAKHREQYCTLPHGCVLRAFLLRGFHLKICGKL